MFQLVAKLVKWVSIPVLLSVLTFSYCSARYAFVVNLAICLGTVVFVQHAVRQRHYLWAAGFAAIVVIASLLPLTVKLLLLMGLTCIGIFITLSAAFRTQPLPVAELL